MRLRLLLRAARPVGEAATTTSVSNCLNRLRERRLRAWRCVRAVAVVVVVVVCAGALWLDECDAKTEAFV